jgi:sulfoxide reductase heme-binding subunit YedZ
VARKTRKHRLWYLGGLGFILLAAVVILISSRGSFGILNGIRRVAALMGYMTLFLAMLSSAYLRQMVRLLGHPFVRVHHILAVTGLAFLTLHPITVAVDLADPSILLPQLRSLAIFLTYGGVVAWYLIGITALTAYLRRSISGWRIIHYLNYIAFWFGSLHAIRIGTDVQPPILRAIPVGLALAIVIVLIQKRVEAYRRKQLRKRQT